MFFIKKEIKTSLAETITLTDDTPSVKAVSASDNHYKSRSFNHQTRQSNRQTTLVEQVPLGNSSPEESDETNRKVAKIRNVCHGTNNGFMNRMHHNHRASYRRMTGDLFNSK